MSKLDTSLEMLSEVMQTANLIGTEKTKQLLVKGRVIKKKSLEKAIEDLIQKQICKAFSISQEKLKTSASKGDRTLALMIGYVLVRKHLDYTYEKIANLFNKDISNISKSIAAFSRLRSTYNQDKVLLDHYDRINLEVTEFKNKNTWLNNADAPN